jgi:hypothetical protein
MLSRRRWGSGVWDMGLPLASMYAKSHDNYYIPVHSRVFSFSFYNLYGTTQKSVHLHHFYHCHSESRFVSVNCVETRRKFCCASLSERSAGILCYRGISKASPPAGCSPCRRRQTCMGSKMQQKKSELAFGVPLSHPSNHLVVHGSPPLTITTTTILWRILVNGRSSSLHQAIPDGSEMQRT